MKKPIIIVAFVSLCVVIGGVFFIQNQKDISPFSVLGVAQDYQRAQVTHDSGKSIVVQMVVSASAQQKGLSGTSSVPEEGMLFVYPTESYPIFWMKDMKYAIDIVWIGAKGEITGVEVAAPPPDSNTPDAALQRYTAPAPTQYVLELQAGKAAEYGFLPGTTFVSAGFLE